VRKVWEEWDSICVVEESRWTWEVLNGLSLRSDWFLRVSPVDCLSEQRDAGTKDDQIHFRQEHMQGCTGIHEQ
jgi:hypothetical protein